MMCVKIFLLSSLLCLGQAVEAEISYVIEPFEGIQAAPFYHSLNYTFEYDDALYGQASLRVSNQTSTNGILEWVTDKVTEPAHSCVGATSLSVWFKVLSGVTTMRVILLEEDGDQLSRVASNQQLLTASEDWQELRMNFTSSFVRVPLLDHIRGWRFELEDVEEVLIDQLACLGRPSLFGAAFNTHDSFADAEASDRWFVNCFQSQLCENMTKTTLENGNLTIDYTVQQTESWGGFVSFAHRAPGNAYYNLSAATQVSFDYSVTRGTSVPGRLHLRFILLDGRGCTESCRDFKSLELYYSFYSVLDNPTPRLSASRYLWGDDEENSPFWRTGWEGVADNHVLDSSNVKGFTVELSVDSQGEINSTVSGSISVGELVATTGDTLGSNSTAQCAIEDDVIFSYDSFRKKEFLDDEKCCMACTEDPDCLFSFTSGRDCFLSSSLESVRMPSSQYEIETFTTMWQDSYSKRGDFCSVCECREEEKYIDCSGKDLLIPPKTFSESWIPKTLDLSNNPRLLLIGSTALESVAWALTDLILPSQLQYLSETSVKSMDRLSSVHFDNGENVHRLQNVLTSSNGFFGNICCSPGSRVNLEHPSNGLTFCDMHFDAAGADAVYLPFVHYFGSEVISTLRPSSDFMAEAAESPEKCAEYCQIQTHCNYFSYDARYAEAEHSCYLAENDGQRSDYVCCGPTSFADEEQTLPGWTSGYPARTRHRIEDARVVISETDTVADESNGYTVQYELSLGSMPQRGAVWVEPTLLASSGLDYEIIPERVALYDNETVVSILVRVLNPSPSINGRSLVISNVIQSCDAAFVPTDAEENTVVISILLPSSGSGFISVGLFSGLAALFVFSLVTMYILNARRKKQSDMIWKVNPSELHFQNPPEIIGHGTFGLVLLAEYRGTKVAVKRVLPTNASAEAEGKAFSSVATPEMASDGKPKPRDDIESGSRSLESTTKVTRRNSARTSGRNLKQDFVEEMRALSKLRHPNITTVMGAVVEKNHTPMLVMEFMQHGSLFDLLRNETIVMEGELLLPIIQDITQGVRFLHASTPQVIHGDLKCANVLVDSRFHAKVADFGLSQKKRLKATGTPFWMAPELLRGEITNSPESDVYSFGIILYELYSRCEPYEGEDSKEVLKLIMDTAVNRRPPVPDSCPPVVEILMKECVMGDATQRPSFEEIDLHLKRLDVSAVEPVGRSPKANASTDILYDMFPKHVAEALRDGRKVEPESRECVTVFFSDIVGFTEISAKLTPMQVSNLLDRLYVKFDKLSRDHDVFKVETIGDAYVSIANLTKDQPDHVVRIASFAIDAVLAANETFVDEDSPELGRVNIRCGFHVGPVVASVVGSRNPRYCLFGDVVNTAARMEQTSEKNCIQCSDAAASLLRQHQHSMDVRTRGMINVKGKGSMLTHWVWPSNMARFPVLRESDNQ